MKIPRCNLFAFVAALCGLFFSATGHAEPRPNSKGSDITKTGLTPRYPSAHVCSPLTSLYASWDDVDGGRRNEPHSGVDGGRFGDFIFAPGPGTVISAWKANWGWGEEGALLIRHTQEDLNLKTGSKFYYSEFDHLVLKEVSSLSEGRRVKRGDKLATVARPGGQNKYLPEVHWEVWQVDDDDVIQWRLNRFRDKYWVNDTASLIDPLHMLGLNAQRRGDGNVDIHIYEDETNYANFRGFTYILPCTPIGSIGIK